MQSFRNFRVKNEKAFKKLKKIQTIGKKFSKSYFVEVIPNRSVQSVKKQQNIKKKIKRSNKSINQPQALCSRTATNKKSVCWEHGMGSNFKI